MRSINADSEEIDTNSKDNNSEETDTSSENSNSHETDTSSENTNSEGIDTCSGNTNYKDTYICLEDTTGDDTDHRKNEVTKALKTEDVDTTEGSKNPVEDLVLTEVDLNTQLSEDIRLRNHSMFPFGCKCDNFTRCMCCGRLEIPSLGIRKKACVRLFYNGDETALTITFLANGKDLFSKKISANNLDPLCFSYPPGNFIVDFCFKFSDIQVKLRKFHFCLEMIPRVLLKKIMTIKVGCFTFRRRFG
ncbi:unnamed protein product [Larinioides sclopetarius]|uniref:DUF4773 domain-containing protein n=1 Tax=Larinioides sclopetarius TaxID=280406 RepID=A0AAV1YRS7_9ARAC